MGVHMQATLAGRFLSGDGSAVVQIILAIVVKTVPLWFVVASVVAFLGRDLDRLRTSSSNSATIAAAMCFIVTIPGTKT